MKKCTLCNEFKSFEMFTKMKNQKDGYNYWCKLCIKSRRKGKPQYNEYKKQWNRNQYQNNLKYRLENNIRCRLNHYLRSNNLPKTERSIKYLGCTISKYKKYLELQFTDEMNWENYGKYWEVDHIIPVSKGGSFHYTNTQPLTITENREKSDKII